jgi:tetratricopeptide (TPR) repeat protein
MIQPDAAVAEADYFDHLADCDEALAGGVDADESWCEQETPDCRPRLQRDLGCLRLLQALRPSRSTELPAPRLIGRFRIQREIGRGGCGVVFLAEDPTLGRLVALKVPRADFLADREHRTRFHTEAQAAARLDHPNIVAIYEAGEVGPLVYIASSYCPGVSLAQWLRQGYEPVPWRDAAMLIASLAEAIEYAHRHGVLHRDLKPANVLIAECSNLQSAVPKITDFGLARLIDADPTQSYAALGTPSYMPPEQATGRSADIGPQSDVYALGAILYELWTGRPPFQGESPFDIIQQVQWQEPLSPGRLRPGMPRDLETICCKCLEKEPRHRYATAGELAADLRHCLANEPIRARPIGTHGRIWRWCRRNPLPASLIAAIGLLLPAALVVVSALYFHATSEANRADGLATRNGIERDKAVANYQRARAVVQRLSRLGNELSDRPGLDRAQALVYEEVLQHCLTFLTESSDDPTIRLDTCRAWRQVGRVRMNFGKAPEAIAAFDHEAELLDTLIAEDPNNRALRIDRALNEFWRGHSLRQTGQLTSAELAYRGAIQMCEELTAEASAKDSASVILAAAWMNLGDLIMTDTSLDASAKAFDKAITIQNSIADRYKEQQSFLQDFALTLEGRARLSCRKGGYAEAENDALQSIALCELLLKKRPQNRSGAYHLARAKCVLAEIYQATNRLADAESTYRDSYESLQKLTADYPGVYEYRSGLVRFCHDLSYVMEMQFRLDDALHTSQQAIELQKRLIVDFPERTECTKYLAFLHRACSRIYGRLDQTAHCLAETRKALALLPDDPMNINQLAWILAMSPVPELRNPAEALRLAELATQAAPKTGDCWNTLAAARYVTGEFRLALQALERGAACRSKMDVEDLFLKSLCHASLGEVDASRECFNEADAFCKAHPPKDPYTIRIRAEAAAASDR